GFDAHEPVVGEIGESLTRGYPDSSAIVLIKRLRRIRDSASRTEDCRFSILQSCQAIGSSGPDAAICRCEHGVRRVARQTLSFSNGAARQAAATDEGLRGL